MTYRLLTSEESPLQKAFHYIPLDRKSLENPNKFHSGLFWEGIKAAKKTKEFKKLSRSDKKEVIKALVEYFRELKKKHAPKIDKKVPLLTARNELEDLNKKFKKTTELLEKISKSNDPINGFKEFLRKENIKNKLDFLKLIQPPKWDGRAFDYQPTQSSFSQKEFENVDDLFSYVEPGKSVTSQAEIEKPKTTVTEHRYDKDAQEQLTKTKPEINKKLFSNVLKDIISYLRNVEKGISSDIQKLNELVLDIEKHVPKNVTKLKNVQFVADNLQDLRFLTGLFKSKFLNREVAEPPEENEKFQHILYDGTSENVAESVMRSLEKEREQKGEAIETDIRPQEIGFIWEFIDSFKKSTRNVSEDNFNKLFDKLDEIKDEFTKIKDPTTVLNDFRHTINVINGKYKYNKDALKWLFKVNFSDMAELRSDEPPKESYKSEDEKKELVKFANKIDEYLSILKNILFSVEETSKILIDEINDGIYDKIFSDMKDLINYYNRNKEYSWFKRLMKGEPDFLSRLEKNIKVLSPEQVGHKKEEKEAAVKSMDIAAKISKFVDNFKENLKKYKEHLENSGVMKAISEIKRASPYKEDENYRNPAKIILELFGDKNIGEFIKETSKFISKNNIINTFKEKINDYVETSVSEILPSDIKEIIPNVGPRKWKEEEEPEGPSLQVEREKKTANIIDFLRHASCVLEKKNGLFLIKLSKKLREIYGAVTEEDLDKDKMERIKEDLRHIFEKYKTFEKEYREMGEKEKKEKEEMFIDLYGEYNNKIKKLDEIVKKLNLKRPKVEYDRLKEMEEGRLRELGKKTEEDVSKLTKPELSEKPEPTPPLKKGEPYPVEKTVKPEIKFDKEHAIDFFQSLKRFKDRPSTRKEYAEGEGPRGRGTGMTFGIFKDMFAHSTNDDEFLRAWHNRSPGSTLDPEVFKELSDRWAKRYLEDRLKKEFSKESLGKKIEKKDEQVGHFKALVKQSKKRVNELKEAFAPVINELAQVDKEMKEEIDKVREHMQLKKASLVIPDDMVLQELGIEKIGSFENNGKTIDVYDFNYIEAQKKYDPWEVDERRPEEDIPAEEEHKPPKRKEEIYKEIFPSKRPVKLPEKSKNPLVKLWDDVRKKALKLIEQKDLYDKMEEVEGTLDEFKEKDRNILTKEIDELKRISKEIHKYMSEPIKVEEGAMKGFVTKRKDLHEKISKMIEVYSSWVKKHEGRLDDFDKKISELEEQSDDLKEVQEKGIDPDVVENFKKMYMALMWHRIEFMWSSSPRKFQSYYNVNFETGQGVHDVTTQMFGEGISNRLTRIKKDMQEIIKSRKVPNEVIDRLKDRIKKIDDLIEGTLFKKIDAEIKSAPRKAIKDPEIIKEVNIPPPESSPEKIVDQVEPRIVIDLKEAEKLSEYAKQHWGPAKISSYKLDPDFNNRVLYGKKLQRTISNFLEKELAG